MSEKITKELEDKTINIINWLEDAIKTSTDFASEQIPLFIQELLHYNFVMSLSWFIVGIIGIIAVIYTAYRLIKMAIKDGCIDMVGPPVVIMGIFILAIFTCVSVNHMDWIKIKLAPRVYLMEYVKDSMK